MKLTDEQMRQAWSRFTTQQIRDMPMPTGKPDETARAYEGRRRILALREAEEQQPLAAPIRCQHTTAL